MICSSCRLCSIWVAICCSTPDLRRPSTRCCAPRWLKQRLIGTLSTPKRASYIAVSDAVKAQYVQAGFDPERIEAIYNGIDPRFLEQRRLDPPVARHTTEDPLRLLYVGRLRAEKGILVALQALALLMREQSRAPMQVPPLRLDVIGDGNDVYRSALERFVQEQHLSEVVHFHGRMQQDALIDHYDRADLLLVPSLAGAIRTGRRGGHGTRATCDRIQFGGTGGNPHTRGRRAARGTW